MYKRQLLAEAALLVHQLCQIPGQGQQGLGQAPALQLVAKEGGEALRLPVRGAPVRHGAVAVLRQAAIDPVDLLPQGLIGFVEGGQISLLHQRAVSYTHLDVYKRQIYVKGEKVHIRTPKDAIKKKIAFLTEDRKGQGLVLSLDVRTNLILANMKGFSNGPFLNKGKIEKSGQDNVESLRIKTPSLDEVTAQLSGGNQQKVVIGKWVNTDADIFIFDEPTRGIDVGAKIEVYHVMNDLVKAGKCVIMVSSELPEILAMSDHVVVMRGGRVMANIDRDTPHFNSEDIMKAAWRCV